MMLLSTEMCLQLSVENAMPVKATETKAAIAAELNAKALQGAILFMVQNELHENRWRVRERERKSPAQFTCL